MFLTAHLSHFLVSAPDCSAQLFSHGEELPFSHHPSDGSGISEGRVEWAHAGRVTGQACCVLPGRPKMVQPETVCNPSPYI